VDAGQPAAHLALQWDVPKMPFQICDGARSLKVGILAAFLDEHGNFVAGREGLIEFAPQRTRTPARCPWG
jgi:hypothetical protein